MSVWIALRNAAGVAIPLLAGAALGRPGGGLVAGIGALNVAFADSYDPYGLRARRLFGASVLIAAAVFCGSLAGNSAPVAIAVAGAWAFGIGMLIALGTATGNMGVSSLCVTVIFAGRPANLPDSALYAALAFGGGLLQTGLSLVLWPVQRYRPERAALGALYLKLSDATASPMPASEGPPTTAQSVETQEALSSLDGDHSVESERYRLLLEQAERSRACVVALSRLRTRARRENAPVAEAIDRFLGAASAVLACIGKLLRESACVDPGSKITELARILEEVPSAERDIAGQMDALARQLRISLDLAGNTTPEGSAAFARRDAGRPPRLRLRRPWEILRANLSLESAVFRHAIRLAVCVAAGDWLGRVLFFQRSYWLPMTIAVILKPDFTSTFSRGLWRLSGTFVGLCLATVLFHSLPANLWLEIGLIAVGMFVLRWAGPANYGLFVVNISGLVVLLAAIVGVAPRDVIAARATNTLVGGTLALFAYWVWPTWERTRIAEVLAKLLDAYRRYFHDLTEACFNPGGSDPATVDRDRLDARLARSNMEASFDRLREEPGTPHRQISAFSAMLASSHAFAHSALALEASLLQNLPGPPASEALHAFMQDVERTFGVLATAIRGDSAVLRDPPDLREDRRRFVKCCPEGVPPNALLDVETDRITNSMNTLREQVTRLVSA